jgi:hypothetical protein
VTSFVQIPHSTLIALGGTLNALSARLQDQQDGAQQCAGLDGRDHARLQAAVEGFRSEWRTSLRTLLANIGKTGDVAAAIGRLAADTDQQLAAALRPDAGGTR